MLIRNEWEAVELAALIDSAVDPFRGGPTLQIAHGPSTQVSSSAVRGLMLAIYELATNSLKYRALAGQAGRVTVGWETAGNRCRLTWEESAPTGPEHQTAANGFGRTLIHAALGGVPYGAVSYRITPDSVLCVFEWQLSWEAR